MSISHHTKFAATAHLSQAQFLLAANNSNKMC